LSGGYRRRDRSGKLTVTAMPFLGIEDAQPPLFGWYLQLSADASLVIQLAGSEEKTTVGSDAPPATDARARLAVTAPRTIDVRNCPGGYTPGCGIGELVALPSSATNACD
jgi:hypothetical protein